MKCEESPLYSPLLFVSVNCETPAGKKENIKSDMEKVACANLDSNSFSFENEEFIKA